MRRKRSRTYKAWEQARQRCTNPRNPGWEGYGGRGIRVCEAWGRYRAFLADLGYCPPGYELDRVDPDGHYEPGNCRWIPRWTGARRTDIRVTLGVPGLYIGNATIPELADLFGLCPRLLHSRIRRGKGAADLIRDPRRQRERQERRPPSRATA